MTGNASYTLRNTALLSVAGLEAPIVVTSAEIEERMAESLTRLKVRPGTLQALTGIAERRWWDEGTTFAEGGTFGGRRSPQTHTRM